LLCSKRRPWPIWIRLFTKWIIEVRLWVVVELLGVVKVWLRGVEFVVRLIKLYTLKLVVVEADI
jgi:hypothetical protein